jgi:uncharacterized membrane protein YfcA
MNGLFFIIAFVYASAGFGGGSMYLALLSSLSPTTILSNKIHGLLCNTAVTAQGSIQWSLQFNQVWRDGWKILLASALACSATAYFFKNEGVLQWIMSAALILAGFALFFQERLDKQYFNIKEWQLIFIAAVVGVVAGMTGIGGGIYLSPILHMSRWGRPKNIATLSVYLILINSILSLAIVITTLEQTFIWHWEWAFTALCGGIIGSRIGIKILNQKQIKTVTAIILIVVGGQMIIKHFV